MRADMLKPKEEATPIMCPNCGAISLNDVVSLDSGSTFACSKCGEDIVVGLFTHTEYTGLAKGADNDKA